MMNVPSERFTYTHKKRSDPSSLMHVKPIDFRNIIPCRCLNPTQLARACRNVWIRRISIPDSSVSFYKSNVSSSFPSFSICIIR